MEEDLTVMRVVDWSRGREKELQTAMEERERAGGKMDERERDGSRRRGR